MAHVLPLQKLTNAAYGQISVLILLYVSSCCTTPSSVPVMHLCICLIRICVCMHENGFYIKLPQIDSLAIQPVQFHLRVQPLVDSVILRYVSIRQHTSAYVSIRQHTSDQRDVRAHDMSRHRFRELSSERILFEGAARIRWRCGRAL